MLTARPLINGLCPATLAACLCALSVTGCIGAAADDDSDVEEIQGELGIGCETDQPDRVFPGKIDPAHVSPRTYGPLQGPLSCYQTYIVDVTGLQAAYAVAGSSIAVKYADSIPAFPISHATCDTLRGEAALYLRQGNSWVKQGTTKVATGTWRTVGGFSFCTPPAISFTGMQAGSSYRVAANMRQGTGTLPPLRALSVQTIKP